MATASGCFPLRAKLEVVIIVSPSFRLYKYYHKPTAEYRTKTRLPFLLSLRSCHSLGSGSGWPAARYRTLPEQAGLWFGATSFSNRDGRMPVQRATSSLVSTSLMPSQPSARDEGSAEASPPSSDQTRCRNRAISPTSGFPQATTKQRLRKRGSKVLGGLVPVSPRPLQVKIQITGCGVPHSQPTPNFGLRLAVPSSRESNWSCALSVISSASSTFTM